MENNFTKEELIKKIKKQKLIAIVHIILLILMVVFAVFSTMAKGVTFHTFLPLFFAPMEIVMLLEIKKLKKDLKSKK